MDLLLCQEWEPPNLGEFCCWFAACFKECPKNCVDLIFRNVWPKIRDCSAVALLLTQGWVSQNSAQGLPLTQKWEPQNSGEFWYGSAPHSEVGASKFRGVLVWICLLIRCGSPIIQEDSALTLPLVQERVPQNLGWFLYGFTPHLGVGERILFWILPVLRSGSLRILESSGVDLPRAQDPRICEALPVHLPHSGLGALKHCGSFSKGT